jgi:hypothetical protein
VADGTTFVNPININDLFSDEYKPGNFGSKALTYIDTNGKMNVVFWKTEFHGGPTDVHHRDALSSILKADAERLERKLASRPAHAENKVNLWILFQEQAERITHERRVAAFDKRILRRAHGFQLTAEYQEGVLKVVNIDVNSSVTRALVANGGPVSEKHLALAISNLYQAMDPRVRAVRTVRIKDMKSPQLSFSKLSDELAKLGLAFEIQPLHVR